MKELKFLYETTVPKEVEAAEIEIREENGQKVEVKKTVKKVKNVKVAILKPDRKLFKAAEMFYAKTLSDYLKQGLLPYSLVAKRYANDGGPLTEREKDRLKELRIEARELEKRFFAAVGAGEEQKEVKNDLLARINEINAEVSNIQNAYSDIFDSTAEMKARTDTIEWWALYLIFADLEDKGYQCVFGDGAYEDRVAKLEQFEDDANPFIVELVKRCSYLISFWVAAKDTVTSIDFGMMEKLFVDTMSEYKVIETEDLKITDQTPSPPPSGIAPSSGQAPMPTT